MNPNKPRGGATTPSTGVSSTTVASTVITSVTTSYSEVSTKLSTADNPTGSSDYQKWQEMKKKFLEEMNQQPDTGGVQETNRPDTNVHGLPEDPEDGKPKFPNFPPYTEETNRVPRDYTTASHSSALSRVSEVTTPSYPSNPSVSTTSHAGSGLRFSSISTTESTTKSSILGVLHSTTEGPIVFTLSPELQVNFLLEFNVALTLVGLANRYKVDTFLLKRVQKIK